MTVLVDSNIPMYLVGAAHPNKLSAQRLLQSAIGRGQRLVTDVEVLQEILHRYTALERRDMIQPAFDAILGLVDEVLPIELEDLDRAKDIALGATRLGARDALHVAVMQRRGIGHVMSFDRDFDCVPGVVRVHT